MPSGDNFKGKKPTNGFTSEKQPAIRGRRKSPSIKDEVEKVLDADGYLTFQAEDVQIMPNGSVKIKVPTREMLAVTLVKNATKDPRYFDMLTKTTGGYITPKNPNEDMIEEVIRQDGGVVIIQQRFIGLI